MMRRRTTPSRGEAGFTLVEVMIALMIFGMLAAAGVAILSFSVRAQAATGARLDDISALNRTVALLSGDLAQAADRATRDESGAATPAFVGGADGAMRFVRNGWSNIDAAPRPTLQKVAYRLDGGVLQRLAYPLLDGAAPLPPMALVDHVAALSARYRYHGAWNATWDGAQGAPLPQAVEVIIRRDDGRVIRLMLLIGTGYAPARVGNAPA